MENQHLTKSFKASIEHKGTKASVETNDLTIYDLNFVAILAISIITVVYFIKKKG